MRDLAKKKQDIWAKWERTSGVPLPQTFRDLVEQDYDDYDGEIYLSDLDGGIEDFFKKIVALQYLPSSRKPKAPVPQKRYQRSFNKRLHLVDFIIGRQLTIRNHRQRSFTHQRRINWKQTCEDWNEAHPYDLMTPEVLKATYYRAVAEEDIQREYFDRKYREYADRFGQLLEQLISENEQAFERFGKAFEKFSQLVVAAFQRVGQFYLNHRDDIESLVLLGDKLNGMPDSDREEYIKLLEIEFEKQKEAQNERTHT